MPRWGRQKLTGVRRGGRKKRKVEMKDKKKISRMEGRSKQTRREVRKKRENEIKEKGREREMLEGVGELGLPLKFYVW